ncbi:MAG: hypothetical protein ACTSU5_10125 [Promethearchaeota archaeon]
MSILSLNWTTASVVLLVATIPEFVATCISLAWFVRLKYRHFLYMFVTWLFLALGNLLIALSYLLLDVELYRVGILASVPLLFSIMVMVDSISRDGVDPKKLFLVTVTSSLMFAFAFEEGTVTLHESLLGEVGPTMLGRFSVAGSVVFLLAGLMWLYYMAKVDAGAPAELKGQAHINLVGACLAGPGSIAAFATGFVWVVPGTDYLLIGIGALLTAYSFGRQPKLGYVLQFKVYRLIAIDRTASIPLFTHTWYAEGLGDETLFTGAFQSICAIFDETLGRGLVQEVKFESGILILQSVEDFPVAFILITSKSTPVLRNALKQFAIEFAKRFSGVVKGGLANEIGQFGVAVDIVGDAFPFVVQYDGKNNEG